MRDPATGAVIFEAWRREGKLHRPDGPAYIERDPATGVATREAWQREGKPHRADGPALIERDLATGAVTREEWWLNGVRQEPPRQKTEPRPSVLSH